LFGVATGWLGWSPSVAWNTPVPEILCAIKYKVEWTNQTNPFAEPKPKAEPKEAKRNRLMATLKAAGARAGHGSK